MTTVATVGKVSMYVCWRVQVGCLEDRVRGVGNHCMYIHTYRCMCPKVPITDNSDKGRRTSAVAFYLVQGVGCKGEVPPMH